jgi:hypothetical protein
MAVHPVPEAPRLYCEGTLSPGATVELSERAAQNGFFGGGSVEFFRILKEWREQGDLAGLEVG